MSAFTEAFFAIDQDHSETITIQELENYTNKNDMDPSFIVRWRTLFDPENTGVITLSKFCDVLGLELNEVRDMRMAQREAPELEVSNAQETLDQQEAPKLPEYLEISVDMPEDLQKSILLMAVEGVKNYPDSDSELVRWLKLGLDKKYGRLWHCVIVRGQYFSFYSYEPHYSFCFKIGPRIYLIYKTPAI